MYAFHARVFSHGALTQFISFQGSITATVGSPA